MVASLGARELDMSYNPTPKALANESALVSLWFHGYGPCCLPGRTWATKGMLFKAPQNERGRHINGPMLPRDYQSFAA